jgi:hypothetical protein
MKRGIAKRAENRYNFRFEAAVVSSLSAPTDPLPMMHANATAKRMLHLGWHTSQG